MFEGDIEADRKHVRRLLNEGKDELFIIDDWIQFLKELVRKDSVSYPNYPHYETEMMMLDKFEALVEVVKECRDDRHHALPR